MYENDDGWNIIKLSQTKTNEFHATGICPSSPRGLFTPDHHHIIHKHSSLSSVIDNNAWCECNISVHDALGLHITDKYSDLAHPWKKEEKVMVQN